jgi:hypothetical protein
MSRVVQSNIASAAIGAAMGFLLPLDWLPAVAGVAAVTALVFAICARIDTKTEAPDNPIAGLALSVLNLPEQPLAKVPDAWPLRLFLAAACFLVSLGLAVMVRANA